MDIALIAALKRKKCLIIFIFALLVSFYYARAAFVLGTIYSWSILLIGLFAILFSLNLMCIVYTIKRNLFSTKKSLLSLISAILGFSSIQACIAGLCNPGIILSLLVIVVPSLGDKMGEIALILLGTSNLILFYSLHSMKCFKRSYEFKLRIGVKK